jgi:hypothetical protein
MEKHVTLVAVLKIGFGIMGITAALVVLAVLLMGGLISQDRDAMIATSILGPLIALIVAVFSVPSIVGGIGLIKRWSWARYLVLVLSVFSLTNIPVGTALGVYSI